MTSQRSSDFTTPTREEIVAISAQHVEMMENSDADSVWVWVNMHHVLLRTIGRRSGREHKVALPFWWDPKGTRVVVGSFAGAERHPAWFLNLSDREANPEVFVRVQGAAYWSVPEILDGEDYDATWAAMLADRPHYADYQVKTERKIPLVRLSETRPA
ncbi:MAG TPA: nitroreductase/quinone reductase family protein [Mycobacteriales bacterium]|nr:nitroreductase/quinone reductase family protein [Mycobacteriales bacterium]